jgi:hypothetical protein
LPENSYIDVFNFSSPKQLAQYLNYVASDETVYNSYFKWKENYCSISSDERFYCDLCYKLNFPHYVKSSLSDTGLIDWWFNKSNCSILVKNNDLIEKRPLNS